MKPAPVTVAGHRTPVARPGDKAARLDIEVEGLGRLTSSVIHDWKD